MFMKMFYIWEEFGRLLENLGERIWLLSWLRYAKLDQHRSHWMRRIREHVKEEEAERESERERNEIRIKATFQRTISFPSPCLCFRGLLDTKALSRHLHEIFNRYWPVSRNMSVASSPPCLAPMASQRKRGVGHVKWHSLFSLSGKDPSYWNGSS